MYMAESLGKGGDEGVSQLSKPIAAVRKVPSSFQKERF